MRYADSLLCSRISGLTVQVETDTKKEETARCRRGCEEYPARGVRAAAAAPSPSSSSSSCHGFMFGGLGTWMLGSHSEKQQMVAVFP